MNNKLMSLLFLINAFLFINCSSKKFEIKEKNLQFISRINEKHKIKKTNLYDGSNNLVNSDELFKFDYYNFKFLNKNLKKYNFQINFSEQSHFLFEQFNSDTVYLKKFNILKNLIYSCVDSTSVIISYSYEKKVKNGFIQFDCTTNDSINLEFLRQKFDEIEIIEIN
ncbi:hypothetical protein [Flavobacterium sp.]|uniref:hypothetical protein n=1 Tax=Flavobacterium sp. TaxID=239 RepID=UPI0035B21AAD